MKDEKLRKKLRNHLSVMPDRDLPYTFWARFKAIHGKGKLRQQIWAPIFLTPLLVLATIGYFFNDHKSEQEIQISDVEDFLELTVGEKVEDQNQIYFAEDFDLITMCTNLPQEDDSHE